MLTIISRFYSREQLAFRINNAASRFSGKKKRGAGASGSMIVFGYSSLM